MKKYSISASGMTSVTVEANDIISAVKKHAKNVNIDQEIGARQNSNLGPTQITIGSNKNGWYRFFVAEI